MEIHVGQRNNFWWSCLTTLPLASIFFLIGLGLSYWGWTIVEHARASASWPGVTGKIIRSEVTHSTDSENGDSYSPEVTYQYIVHDLHYENTIIKFGENAYSNRKKAEEIAARYPVGNNVTVYYDPKLPDRSVLEPGISAGSFIVLGIGVLFVVIPLVVVPIIIFTRRDT